MKGAIIGGALGFLWAIIAPIIGVEIWSVPYWYGLVGLAILAVGLSQD